MNPLLLPLFRRDYPPPTSYIMSNTFYCMQRPMDAPPQNKNGSEQQLTTHTRTALQNTARENRWYKNVPFDTQLPKVRNAYAWIPRPQPVASALHSSNAALSRVSSHARSTVCIEQGHAQARVSGHICTHRVLISASSRSGR